MTPPPNPFASLRDWLFKNTAFTMSDATLIDFAHAAWPGIMADMNTRTMHLGERIAELEAERDALKAVIAEQRSAVDAHIKATDAAGERHSREIVEATKRLVAERDAARAEVERLNGLLSNANQAVVAEIKKIANTPAEPSPGEGWRWLEVGELLLAGDEFLFGSAWKTTDCEHAPVTTPRHYRRRIEPEVGKAVDLPDACNVRDYSSRTCERGVDGCVTRHKTAPTPPQVRVPLDMSDFVGPGRVTHVRWCNEQSATHAVISICSRGVWVGVNRVWSFKDHECVEISRDHGLTWVAASKVKEGA